MERSITDADLRCDRAEITRDVHETRFRSIAKDKLRVWAEGVQPENGREDIRCKWDVAPIVEAGRPDNAGTISRGVNVGDAQARQFLRTDSGAADNNYQIMHYRPTRILVRDRENLIDLLR